MSLREYVPPPKKAVGYAVIAFVVVVAAIGLNLTTGPVTLISEAKAHASGLFTKVKGLFTKTS